VSNDYIMVFFLARGLPATYNEKFSAPRRPLDS